MNLRSLVLTVEELSLLPKDKSLARKEKIVATIYSDLNSDLKRRYICISFIALSGTRIYDLNIVN